MTSSPAPCSPLHPKSASTAPRLSWRRSRHSGIGPLPNGPPPMTLSPCTTWTWPALRRDLDQKHLVEFSGPSGTAAQRTATTTEQRRILTAVAASEPPLVFAAGPTGPSKDRHTASPRQGRPTPTRSRHSRLPRAPTLLKSGTSSSASQPRRRGEAPDRQGPRRRSGGTHPLGHRRPPAPSRGDTPTRAPSLTWQRLASTPWR